MKREFVSARTTQDYRDVGLRGVHVLEAISRTVYDPQKHLRDGETEPAVDKTTQRIGRYVEDSLFGKENKDLRALIRNVSDLANGAKHTPTTTRRDAGIAADAIILLANILRRVDEDP